ncbi:Txe/YoeB family addiction module toxin [Microbacterium sp. VKM Ac-2923]|uniref:Txe/YoeB family addiction module toxin n=1 Tax=Microbacterium sp. VKM Ac-2923 TaxID=2929476 RepID=UPI001FB36467|nr:Txe/YoeB family addiction module toxin [Microbacterium sp. VKM Ac-2923]MCJ1706928.1 Txe/YoeB family addiction module toxin [Microbacterium sp. VKM Ac-2923]
MTDRILAWTSEAWDDYLYWQTQDKKTLRRINQLIADILRDDPFEGIGKPEPLKHALAGAWSRRIDEANRLVYIVDDRRVTILQARYHY